MKAIVLSDSHGGFSALKRAVDAEIEAGGLNMIMFAGDIQRDAEALKRAYPRLPVAAVLGNNDWSVRDVPLEVTFSFAGKRVFMTHGHRYGVKMDLISLLYKSREEKADICVFGHTHHPYSEEVSGILMFNPGCARISYGTLEIDENGKITAEIKETP